MGIASESWKTLRYNHNQLRGKTFFEEISKSSAKRVSSTFDIRRFQRKVRIIYKRKTLRLSTRRSIFLTLTAYFLVFAVAVLLNQ